MNIFADADKASGFVTCFIVMIALSLVLNWAANECKDPDESYKCQIICVFGVVLLGALMLILTLVPIKPDVFGVRFGG